MNIHDLEAEIAERSGDVSQWRALLDMPVWKKYITALDEQVRERQLTITHTPLASFGQVLPQEFMKGEASGLGLAKNLPQLMFEAAQAEISRLNDDLRRLSDETKPSADGGSRVDDQHFFGGDEQR